MNDQPPEWLSTEQFAERLGKSVFTIRRYCRNRARIVRGAEKIGRDWRIPAANLNAKMQ